MSIVRVSKRDREECKRLNDLIRQESDQKTLKAAHNILKTLANTTQQAHIREYSYVTIIIKLQNTQITKGWLVDVDCGGNDTLSIGLYQSSEFNIEGPVKDVKALLKPYNIKLVPSKAFRDDLKAMIKRLIIGMQLTKD
jgi:hypothetical protein